MHECIKEAATGIVVIIIHQVVPFEARVHPTFLGYEEACALHAVECIPWALAINLYCTQSTNLIYTLESQTIIILIERQIQSSGRNSIFGIFVNPIMWKAATLIIFK